jgi:replicative DNA helicase
MQQLNFEQYSDRLPPQNVEAEEAILGGLLFDPEAIARVEDLLSAEAFYLEAHRKIYRVMIGVRAQGRPTDLIAVISGLKDQGWLEMAGGQSRLVELAEQVVSAANIDQHARLVAEKATRRKLIQVGGEISQLGYAIGPELPHILDQAEQKVFAITQERPEGALSSAAEILTGTFASIEQRNLGLSLPGLSCGFYDLDAMTQGFQRSDLVILAGRPAMGKTAFAMNLARNVAAFHKLPVAIYSLEMSKEQLVQRMLSSEARIESGRLRSGRISQHEWEPLGQAIGTLSQVPLYIDDTPNITVNEIRSKSRRLMAEQGGALGLIVIDYLQLMEGGGENRVQELAKITRSLKQLARELSVPVIALSQLSRGVESRANKRPMMSDLRESGSIEQDADLIVVLYRDEYYNPDTPDKGIAEAIIVKHRNGPTGTVKLLFESRFTQFLNLAR